MSSPFVAVYCRRNGSNGNRLGITVSTKVGKAVQRNRVRRRFKEIYRLNENNLAKGYDIVIVARVRARFAEYEALESSILSLMKKLNLMPGAKK